MIDQLTLPSNPPPSQNTNTNPSNTSNPPLFLDLSANLMAAPTNSEIMKIYKLPIEEILPLDPALGIRRALTIDSKFICYINTENSVVIKSIDYAFLSFTVRGPQAQVMDVCLFEGANFSVLGIMYKDGTLSGYQIGINEASSSIIVRHFLGYKIEGTIERPLIMWKDLSKIGVCLRNELILIEVSVEGGTNQGQEKTKEFEQELKPNNFKVLSFDENIKDFCFSPKYHLVYLLFESNVVKVINTENGLEIRGFQPYSSNPSANIIRLLSFKNLAKKGGSLTNAASQKPEINKDHDYSLKDIFITVTEAGEIKVWDLSEWDNKAKTYYCVEERNLNENNEVEMKLVFSFFDPGRNGLYLVYSQGEEKGLSVAVLGINSFFHSYQENYKDLKKSNKFFTSTERIALKEEKLVNIAALNAKGAGTNEEKDPTKIQIQTSGPKAKYNFVILTHNLASFVSVFASINFPQLPQRKHSTQILKKPSDSPMRRSSSHHEFSPKQLPWEPRNLDKILADLKLDESILKRVLESGNAVGVKLHNDDDEEPKVDLLAPPVALVKAKSDNHAQNNLTSLDAPLLSQEVQQNNEKEPSDVKKSPSKKKKAKTTIIVQAPGSGEVIPSDPTPLEASVLDIPEPAATSKKSKKKKKKEAAAAAALAQANAAAGNVETPVSQEPSETKKLELTIPIPNTNANSSSKKSKNKMNLPLLSPTQSTPEEQKEGGDFETNTDSKKSKGNIDSKKVVSPVSSVSGTSEIGAGKKVVVRQDQVGENVKQWVQGFVDKKVVGFEKKMGNIDELIEKKFIEKVESKLQAMEQRVIAKAQDTMQKNLSKALEKPYQSINRINQINQQMKQAFESEKKGYQQKIKQQEDQLKKFKEEVNQTLNSFTQIMTVTLQSLPKSQAKVQELEQNLQTKSSEVSSLIQYTKVMLQQEEEYRNRVHTLEKNVQFIAKECLSRLEASVQETSSPNKTTESATPSIQFVQTSELIKEADISDNYKKVVQEIFDSVRQMNTPEQINQSLAHITNNLANNNSLQNLLAPENNNIELSRRSSTQSQLQNPLINPLVNFQQPPRIPFPSIPNQKPSGTSPKQAENEGFPGPLEFNKDPVLLFQEALIGQGSFNLEGIHQHPTKSRFKANFVDSSNASVKDGFEESEDRPESELSRPPGLDYYSESGESLNNLLPKDLLLDDIQE